MVGESIEQLLDQAGRRIDARDFAAAGALAARALKQEPMNVRGLCFAAIIAAETGQKESAVTTIERALKLASPTPGVANNAACVFARCGQTHRAMDMWRRLLEMIPDSVPACYNLGISHARLGDPDSAEPYFRKVMALQPDHPHVHMNLADVAKNTGRIQEALAFVREGVRRHPHDMCQHGNLLYGLHFDPAYTPDEIVRQSAEWGRTFESAIPAWKNHENDRSPGRRLRVGYISANFRDHSETYFVLPLFRASDRGALQTWVYSCNEADDAVTPLLRRHADSWRDVAAWDDQKLAQTIRDDQIDVLVDLTMHMQGGRLGVFARKPAPVQLAWLAYPSTTGLTRMDYTILDPHLYTQNARHFTESPHVLPRSYWCYEVYGPRPEVSQLPATINGGVTFGSLNHFGKVSRQTLSAWAQILRRVDRSRLILYVESKRAADDIRALLAEQGVSPSRLVCQPRLAREAYLLSYHGIDIALDPFPYNGATTTCDALWMGVPVVSLAGATAVSRAGLSLLSNLGLPELVAQTWDQYIAIAQKLAADLPALQNLRQSLRGRMEQSVIMDASAFAADMGQAYRVMWQRWCDRQ